MLPDQRYTRKLPQEYTKGMVEFTSEKPQARMDAILRGIGQAQTQSVRIIAAVLPPRIAKRTFA